MTVGCSHNTCLCLHICMRAAHQAALPCCADGGARSAKRQKTAKLPAAIVLDIEGTVAPISFVTEV
jgi:hypothetical protein